MGFFNWVMHGLGFEDKQKKVKKQAEDNKYSNFNLHVKPENTQEAERVPNMTTFNSLGIQAESNIIMVEPKSQKEIQKVVDYLKQGQSVAVNLEGISGTDSDRILDFLSGAIYGLNGSIHRWYGDLFLLAPEGHKILKPDDKG